jgi:hypothetical protein
MMVRGVAGAEAGVEMGRVECAAGVLFFAATLVDAIFMASLSLWLLWLRLSGIGLWPSPVD